MTYDEIRTNLIKVLPSVFPILKQSQNTPEGKKITEKSEFEPQSPKHECDQM